jgi:hypothetical protein
VEKRNEGSRLSVIVANKRSEAEEVLGRLLVVMRAAGVLLPSACLDRQDTGFTGDVLVDLGRIRVDHARSLCAVVEEGLKSDGRP